MTLEQRHVLDVRFPRRIEHISNAVTNLRAYRCDVPSILAASVLALGPHFQKLYADSDRRSFHRDRDNATIASSVFQLWRMDLARSRNRAGARHSSLAVDDAEPHPSGQKLGFVRLTGFLPLSDIASDWIGWSPLIVVQNAIKQIAFDLSTSSSTLFDAQPSRRASGLFIERDARPDRL